MLTTFILNKYDITDLTKLNEQNWIFYDNGVWIHGVLIRGFCDKSALPPLKVFHIISVWFRLKALAAMRLWADVH